MDGALQIDITAERTKRRRTTGRKDTDKQEAVIELEIIRNRVEELVGLYRSSQEARGAFGDAIKAAAESSGLLAATVRKFVVARAGDDFGEAARKAAQLALVFEEVGE